MKLSINRNQVVVSLLIGFALGMIFGQWQAHESVRSRWKHGSMQQHMLEKFNKELHLTADQKTKVAAIFEAKRPKMLALQAEMQPKFEALRKSTQAEVREVLDPGQQKKFDVMNAKMTERWQERSKFLSS